MKESRFLVCDGGPHLLLPQTARAKWKGIGDDLLDPNTDYGRAGRVSSPIGLIAVDDDQALVIAGNPPMTAWGNTPRADTGIDIYVLESWNDPDLDGLIRMAVAATPAEGMVDTGLRWSLKQDGATLMFAGDRPGSAVHAEIFIPIKAGTYRIFAGRFEAEQGRMAIFRLASFT